MGNWWSDNKGWICPRCGKALAPWVRECGCVQPTFAYPQLTSPYEFETITVLQDNGTWWLTEDKEGTAT